MARQKQKRRKLKKHARQRQKSFSKSVKSYKLGQKLAKNALEKTLTDKYKTKKNKKKQGKQTGEEAMDTTTSPEAVEGMGPRVKFDAVWEGTPEELINTMPSAVQLSYKSIVEDMADALWEMEQAGAAPVYPDGKVGGNASALLVSGQQRYIVVSKSGKLANIRMDTAKDVCVVSEFDTEKWRAKYVSVDSSVLPTSDTPMHHAVLNASHTLGWKEYPGCTLHGHALAEESVAVAAGLPCSPKLTLFSTPEDTEAMTDLLVSHPYPEHKVYIRKDHGFFILGKNMKDAVKTFRKIVKPLMK